MSALRSPADVRKGITDFTQKPLLTLFALLLLGSVSLRNAAAQSQEKVLYWTDSKEQSIFRGDVATREIGRVLSARVPSAFERAGGDLYLANRTDSTLNAVGPDGDLQTLAVGAVSVSEMAVDLQSNSLFWLETPSSDGQIRRTRLDDSSSVETLYDDLADPNGLAVDTLAERIYWAENTSEESVVKKANLEGTKQETVASQSRPILDVALDQSHDKLYWISDDTTNSVNSHTIKRAALDGSSVETVLSGVSARHLALSSTGNQIYWAGPDVFVRTAAEDPAQTDTLFVTRTGTPLDDVDWSSAEERAYWIEEFPITASNVWQYDLSTKKISKAFIGFGTPASIAFHRDSSYVYWTTRRGKILRAEPNGAHVEELASVLCGIGHLTGIALGSTRMYWGQQTDCVSIDIQSANLDGSDFLRDLVPGIDNPADVALDTAQQHIYWVNNGQSKAVRRAKTDGSARETLFSDLPSPSSIALDIGSRSVYWTDFAGSIWRASMDESDNKEEVLGGLDRLSGLALDAESNVMYWGGEGTIQRASLNGEQIEDVFTGLAAPKDIAVAIFSGVSTPRLPKRPGKVRLADNYPNPFRSETRIRFALPSQEHVSLTVYDVIGRKVVQLVDRVLNPGRHTVRFNANGVSSGVYFYRIRAGNSTQVKRMIIVE